MWQSVLQQRIEGNDTIVGLMVESHLEEGNQKLGKDGTTGLRYGVSITDECVGWETTQRMLRSAHDVLGGKEEKGPRDQEAVVMRRSTSVFSTSSTSS